VIGEIVHPTSLRRGRQTPDDSGAVADQIRMEAGRVALR
jgi:hypothetical protein